MSAPEITSVSPSSGPAGTVVTLTGSGFSNVNGMSMENAQGQSVAVNFVVISDTAMTFTVPASMAVGVDDIQLNFKTTLVDSGGFTVTTTPPPPGPGAIGLWASDWRGAPTSRTAAQWQYLALHEHAVVGEPNSVYESQLTTLHAANPKLLVLAYNLGPYLAKGSANYTSVLAQHPDYFARDSAGNLITVPNFPSNTLMDPTNAGYRAWAAAAAASAIAGTAFDGLMFDSMGTGAFSGYTTAPPTNPQTHVQYTLSQWLTAEVLLLNAIKAALPASKFLAFNGLVSETKYAATPGAPTSADDGWLATSNADAGVAERWLRNPTDSLTAGFPSASDVTTALKVMADMQAKGKQFWAWSKTWTTPAGTAAQIAQWEGVVLAVYLLGQQTGSYLDFSPSHDGDDTQAPVTFPNLLSALGQPSGPYSVAGAVFTRQFQHGTVTLNTSTNTGTISLH